MISALRNTVSLPSCVLAGLALLFLVLASALPAAHVVALLGVSAVVLGLGLARLRREVAGEGLVGRTSRAAN